MKKEFLILDLRNNAIVLITMDDLSDIYEKYTDFNTECEFSEVNNDTSIDKQFNVFSRMLADEKRNIVFDISENKITIAKPDDESVINSNCIWMEYNRETKFLWDKKSNFLCGFNGITGLQVTLI